ncbi:MAG TPA: 5'-3' exonuclease H3TH domain-containing protein, partial [Ktedonobacteraceae bacterium]|nr:5'-3' exonuclease H3TH domain-containing protein [Ktedonobacteraceae bacterium]
MNETMKPKKLVLVDGHAIIHRAFHAVPDDLSTSSGEPVNATFGFTSMLMKALLEEKPDYIAVTFDRPTPTFRHVEYTPYKAHRPTLPDNMKPQFGRIRDVVQAFGIQIYEKDGYEADDILGTLSVQAAQEGVDTVIYTGDMDTLQLVNDHVRVKVAKRGISEVTEYDEAETKARYSLPPQRLPDFKGLVGDKSDNIPGVPGIGEKTASRLINEYGDLEGVLAHVDELKPKEKKLLQEAADQARQSKFLATIVLDAPVRLDLPSCRLTHVDTEKVLALFRQLEFRSLVERVLALFRRLGISNIPEELLPAPPEKSAQETLIASDEAPEENLLYAPPVGVVPVMQPPTPPGEETASVLTTPKRQSAASSSPASSTAVEEGPMQLSLFEVAEPHTEIVHKLRLPGPAGSGVPLLLDEEGSQSTNTMIVSTEEALRVLVKSFYDVGEVAVDTETTSDDQRHAQLVGLSFSMAAGEAYYIPVGHTTTVDGQEPGTQLPLSFVLEKLKPVLEDEAVRKYMHNAKYDLAVLSHYG